jgi:hypothetical protein
MVAADAEDPGETISASVVGHDGHRAVGMHQQRVGDRTDAHALTAATMPMGSDDHEIVSSMSDHQQLRIGRPAGQNRRRGTGKRQGRDGEIRMSGHGASSTPLSDAPSRTANGFSSRHLVRRRSRSRAAKRMDDRQADPASNSFRSRLIDRELTARGLVVADENSGFHGLTPFCSADSDPLGILCTPKASPGGAAAPPGEASSEPFHTPSRQRHHRDRAFGVVQQSLRDRPDPHAVAALAVTPGAGDEQVGAA